VRNVVSQVWKRIQKDVAVCLRVIAIYAFSRLLLFTRLFTPDRVILKTADPEIANSIPSFNISFGLPLLSLRAYSTDENACRSPTAMKW